MSWIRSVTKKTKKKRWIENLALREAMQRLNSREKHIDRTALLRRKDADGSFGTDRNFAGTGEPFRENA